MWLSPGRAVLGVVCAIACWWLFLLRIWLFDHAGEGVSIPCALGEEMVFFFEHYVLQNAPAPLARLSYLRAVSSKRCLRDPRMPGEQLPESLPENASRFQHRLLDQYHPLKIRLHESLARIAVVTLGIKDLGLRADFLGEPSVSTRYRGARLGIAHPKQLPWWWVPGLEAKTSWRPETFAWVPQLEARFPDILEECLAVNRGEGFSGYRVPRGEMSVIKHWKTFHLTGQTGMVYWENIARVPRTWEALSAVPRLEPHNMLMFSAVMPGTGEGAHTGWSNLFLRCHLTLVNREPARAWITVGGERLSWQEGKVLIFDDSFWHSFRNEGAAPRVVLFFDVWHPSIPDGRLPELKRLYGEWRRSETARPFQERLRDVERASPKDVMPIG